MTSRLFLKLIAAVLALLALAMVAADILASRVAASNYIDSLTRELADKARLVTRNGNLTDPGAVRDLARMSHARLTVVASDGRVLADSGANPQSMENHRARPEIASALAGKQGSSIRPSSTVGVDFLYVAVPMDGKAVRLAVPLSEVGRHVNALRRRMLAAVVLAFLPALLLAAIFARHVSRKLGRIIEYSTELARGNLHARLDLPGGGELGMLGRKLNETGETLQKMVAEVEREHAELEKVERIRKDFVINVSHELRTPLASIQGYTETLLDGALYDRQNNVRFLEIIRKSAERLARLTADLITLSQVELKTRKLRLAPHDVGTILADCCDSMRPIAAKKNITITLEAASEGVRAFCDSEAVFQTITNLVDNAIKYTPEGGSITVAAKRSGREMVEVSVQDTGIGIPAEDLPRLFERFYRVDKARSRELGGTGLGLAIVKHLVRAQGGDIRVESQPGEGSTFAFTLPIQEAGAAGSVPVHTELTVL